MVSARFIASASRPPTSPTPTRWFRRLLLCGLAVVLLPHGRVVAGTRGLLPGDTVAGDADKGVPTDPATRPQSGFSLLRAPTRGSRLPPGPARKNLLSGRRRRR